MRKGPALLLFVILVTSAMGAGCKRGSDQDLSTLGPSSAATTTVLPVGSSHCPGGGIGIYTGNDANGNGLLDAPEVQKGSPVCDQLTDAGGPIGNTTLVMVVSEPASTLHCLAGGLKVLSGADANRNGLLDANEIAFTDHLCNGTPGSSSATGITVAVGPLAAPAAPEGKKKGRKPEPAKKPAGKASSKAADKAAAKTAKSAPAKKESAEAAAAPESRNAPAEPAAQPKKAAKKAPPASPDKEKKAAAKPAAAPAGWTGVRVNAPNLAAVAYKVEGRTIAVRFTNLSSTSSVRFKYTVRWKVNQNGNWVDDSTMEGISFRLKPQETLDREVRTQTPDVRDVVVDLDVVETS